MLDYDGVCGAEVSTELRHPGRCTSMSLLQTEECLDPDTFKSEFWVVFRLFQVNCGLDLADLLLSSANENTYCSRDQLWTTSHDVSVAQSTRSYSKAQAVSHEIMSGLPWNIVSFLAYIPQFIFLPQLPTGYEISVHLNKFRAHTKVE